MSWLRRLIGGRSASEQKPQRLDYLQEALALEKSGDVHSALTSYRLALREKPDDEKILMNMAIAYTRTAQVDEALRCYKRALEIKPDLPGAHYGVAFILIKRGDLEEAASHLEAFLATPGKADPANVEHARQKLEELRNPAAEVEDAGDPEQEQ